MHNGDQLDQAARLAARNYMGNVTWPTVILGVTVATAYVATAILAARGALPLAAAVPFAMALTYLMYTVFHEAAHGTISGSNSSLRWLNELMGYLAGQILMVPLTAHRHEHLAHHRHTNNPETDPDFMKSDLMKSPWQALKMTLRLLVGQYAYYLRHRWGAGPRSQDIRFCLELASALALRVAFVAQGFWLEGALLFIVGWLGGMTVLFYLFAYLVHKPYEQEGRYVDTATIIVPGPLGRLVTWLWVFQNYHSIHHLFPRVPFYRYRELFADIEDTMRAKGAPIYVLGASGIRPAPAYS